MKIYLYLLLLLNFGFLGAQDQAQTRFFLVGLGNNNQAVDYDGYTIEGYVENDVFDAWLATKTNPSELCIILYMCYKHKLYGAFQKVLGTSFFQQYPLYSLEFDANILLCPKCGIKAKQMMDELLSAIISLNMADLIPRT